MSRPPWSRVRSILEQALEREAAERAGFLAEACGGDAGLLAEVEHLLELEREGPAFESPTKRLELPAPEPVPTTIGAYRIERSLGAGGMGEVYLARRTGPGFEQLVALKLVKLGMDTRDLLGRFDRERAVLAGLQHDAIARLIDAGATETGRPYLVMEYVEGQPIDRWCDEHRASVRERVALVRAVAGAVQHAHQHLVLHRDLKPGNILVTADGRPKLLDFGLAKLLPGEGEAGPERTLAGQCLGTPAYASPEQLRGETVGVASDVYSLGIVLYELLAGERPFGSRSVPTPMLGETPERPSTRVRGKTAVAELRRSQPQRLRSEIAGDLDTILLKALHPEPRLRYPTVEAFARDLGRFLDGRPVEARPDSLSYRAAKFVGRHRIAVAAASVVLACLLASGAWAVHSYRRVLDSRRVAQEQRDLADDRSRRLEARESELRGLAVRLMTEVHDSLSRLQGATEPSQAILNLSLETLASFFSSEDAGPDELLEGATAFLRLASVQGVDIDPRRVEPEGIDESLCRAFELAERALELDPGSAAAHGMLADIHAACARHAQYRGDFTRARHEADRSLEAAARAGGSQDSLLDVRLESALRRGEVALDLRNSDEALAAFSEAERLSAEMLARFPGEDALALSARMHDDLARVFRTLGKGQLALEHGDQALELTRGLSDLRPNDMPRATDHAIALIRGTTLRCDLGLHAEAVAFGEEAVASTSRLMAIDTSNAEPKNLCAEAWNKLGMAQLLADDPRAADSLVRAIELYESLISLRAEDLALQRECAAAQHYLGSALLWDGRLEEGLRAYAAAIARMEALCRSAADPLPYEHDVLAFRVNLLAALPAQAFAEDGAVIDAAAARACEDACQEFFEHVDRLGGDERLLPAVRDSMPMMRRAREMCRAALSEP
jgi:serine/threonine protein kinase/tetratricopeptide (TPR) repeat protein